jgi:hypothetical protein
LRTPAERRVHRRFVSGYAAPKGSPVGGDTNVQIGSVVINPVRSANFCLASTTSTTHR